MDDEVLARLAKLVGVVNARVNERLLDAVTIDRRRCLLRVLLDDREQVTEQPPLDRGQLCPVDRSLTGRILDPVDGGSRGRNQRRRSTAGAIGAPALAGSLSPRAAQPLARRFALLLRNRRPSSCRFA
jgi:hypothetical protein